MQLEDYVDLGKISCNSPREDLNNAFSEDTPKLSHKISHFHSATKPSKMS